MGTQHNKESFSLPQQVFWNRVARVYTPFQERREKQQYQQIASAIVPWLNHQQALLELACGTGQLTALLHQHTASWIATDFSPNMVEQTRQRFQGVPVTTEVQDATALRYKDEQFDAVLMANGLHIMPRPDLALAEIGRVLKPGGLLIAPSYVYEGRINRPRLWLLAKMGFVTYFRWNQAEYIDYVSAHGFQVKATSLIPGRQLPACVLIAQKP